MSFQFGKSGKSYDAKLELNITPMVDVMLVLLIIFIITAPLIKPQEIKIDLPKTTGVVKQTDQKNIRLVLGADGSLFLDGKLVSEAQLISVMSDGAGNPSFHMEVQADGNIPYKGVAQVMALAQKHGVKNLSFVTTER
jgi:biopolymer transport protein ExbD